MNFSFKTLSIIGASIVAVLLVGGAYVVSGAQNPLGTGSVSAASTEEALKTLAAKDSDSDGLTDWEESLYGTNPNDAHSVDKTLTDKEAVSRGLVKPKVESAAPNATIDLNTLPGITPADDTLTAEFTQVLFSNIPEGDGINPPSQDEISAFVGNALSSFLATHKRPDAFTKNQETVVGSGSAALAAYASGADAAFAAHTIASDRTEIDYYFDVVSKNDATALAKVKSIGAAYTAIAKALIKVPVPQEAATAHLRVANALALMGSVTSDMGADNTDPLRALLGLGGYQDAVLELVAAFTDMNAVFKADQVSLTQGQAGYSFYSTALQAAKSSPTTP